MTDIERIIEEIAHKFNIGIDYSSGADMAAVFFTGDKAEMIISALREKEQHDKIVYPKLIYVNPCTGKLFRMCCTACDGQVSAKDTYCKHCGRKLKEDTGK